MLERIQTVAAQVGAVVVGKQPQIKLALACLLARGHLLIEDLPGVGKTTLAHALSMSLGLQFKRVQFTNDLLPADIVGLSVFDRESASFVFHPGPVFSQVLLADEINRASPKTQSALLEAMQERCVTLLGTTRTLPDPFFVLASQNPIELEGTYPLPEAQLDRFLFKLNVMPADVAVLEEIISTRRRGEPPAPGRVVSHDELASLFAAVDRIFLPKAVGRYIARIVAATHAGAAEATKEISEYVAFGASPRAAIALAEAARAMALFDSRPAAGFDDVKRVADAVLNHRVLTNYRARLDGVTSSRIVAGLLGSLEESGVALPDDVEISVRGSR